MDKARILVVDDEPMNLEIIEGYLEEGDYDLQTCRDGEEAIARLEAEPERFDVVLLDRMMPRMNGMEVLQRMKAHERLRQIPVILQTAMSAKEDILEGIQAGAYYYLTKPFTEEMLYSVVTTAVRDSLSIQQSQRDLADTTRTLGLMVSGQFRFRSLGEARSMAALLASTCPDPEKVVVGLTELLVNAVEHGNLGISYDDKSDLNERGEWYDEIERRLAAAEYAARYVEVRLARDRERIEITIEDQGDGFEWQHYLQLSPERAMDNHGRGIALASMLSFDALHYQGRGNRVTATVQLANPE